jgi:SAM-dependent methyltransferase
VFAGVLDGDGAEGQRLAGIRLLTSRTAVQSNEVMTRNSLSQFLRVSLLLALCTLAAQAQNAPAQTPKRETSTPYTGDLSIFESPGRDKRLHIDRVMEALSISQGKGVADIGAGSGWFTVRAARRVGSTGKVYAVDINPEAVRYIDRRVEKESIRNVKTVLSKADDPMLPKDAVDAVLLLKTYHEVSDPVRLLENLRPALKPGARVGVIDRNGKGTDHGVGRDVVIEEAARAGYRLLQTYDFVKDDGMDYFLVFTQR